MLEEEEKEKEEEEEEKNWKRTIITIPRKIQYTTKSILPIPRIPVW